MEEKENSNEKLIETVNVTNKVRNNIKSPEQILEKSFKHMMKKMTIMNYPFKIYYLKLNK